MSGSSSPSIQGSTRCCAVFGHPIQHSGSPAMQNAGIAALGLDWRYLAFDVAPEHLNEALQGARSMKFVGLNLTVPHKLLALEWVDELDRSAAEWKAINTIAFLARSDSGDWQPIHTIPPDQIVEIKSRGFNTDADALLRALKEELEFEPAGASVLVLGAGGAGRVAALRLAAAKIKRLSLVNRTSAKAAEVSAEIRRRFPDTEVELGYPNHPLDLVINATSLGLKENNPLPLDCSKIRLESCRAVYDLIYRPAFTPLLSAARAAGCNTANGLGMLLYQGARALEIWSGKPAPLSVMRQALIRHIYV